ncbi:MAG TPA: hypothetical protein VJH23_02080 [archaeon]|nr:hypothetical protein [archaeon]
MAKPLEVFIPLLLLMGLMLPFGHAATGTGGGSENSEPVVVELNIDLSGVINAIDAASSGIQGTVNTTSNDLNKTTMSIPDIILGMIKETAKESIKSFNKTLMEFTKHVLSNNPDVEGLKGWWQSIVTIISSFYLLVFLIAGFMFLFAGIDLSKREQAKHWLTNAIKMIIGVNISFALYQIILELATAITQFIWISGFDSFFSEAAYANAGFALLFFYAATIAIAAITLFLRYLFLMLGVVLFPIAIFLFYTPKLENWGKMILNLLGGALFMQFIDVIMFVAANQILLEPAGTNGQSFVIPLGFSIVAIVNILIIAYAILKSAFSVAENAPVLTYAIGALTGQIGMLANAMKPQPQPAPREGNAVQ